MNHPAIIETYTEVHGDPFRAARHRAEAQRLVTAIDKLSPLLDEYRTYTERRVENGKDAGTCELMIRCDILKALYDLTEVDELCVAARDLAQELGVGDDD